MSLRRHGRRNAFRPATDLLESRQLLSTIQVTPTSKVATGTDPDGDRWTLRLSGPGELVVVGNDGLPTDPDDPQQIDTINLAGTDSETTRLVGTIRKAAGGDGKVFFRQLLAASARVQPHLDPVDNTSFGPFGNGVHVIDMPNFWLGDTDPADLRKDTTRTDRDGATIVGAIEIPDGVSTLRFGGADVTAFFGDATDGKALGANGRADRLRIDLGLPLTAGTSVIVDRMVSNAETTTTGTTTRTLQDSVFVDVSGRVNLFQANSIEGNLDPTLAPSQFGGGTTATTVGGTVIISEGATDSTQFASITGAYGEVRIGGNATNFTTLVGTSPVSRGSADLSPEGATDARISNYFVGGETRNVMLIAPGGARTVSFGKGMDTAIINARFINQLSANRGALNSKVTVNRDIKQVTIGGDVEGTYVQVGYEQALESAVVGALGGQVPPSLLNLQEQFGGNGVSRGVFTPQAQDNGDMTVLIAGDVIDSVFSASVQPNAAQDGLPGTIGDSITLTNGQVRPNDIILPRGKIKYKVEGIVNNTGLLEATNDSRDPATTLFVAPQAVNRAFFARTVQSNRGPVIPPTVPEAPYPRGGGVAPHTSRRVAKGLQPNVNRRNAQAAIPVATPTRTLPAGPLRSLTGGRLAAGATAPPADNV
jgi:hypothetical protein